MLFEPAPAAKSLVHASSYDKAEQALLEPLPSTQENLLDSVPPSSLYTMDASLPRSMPNGRAFIHLWQLQIF